MIIFPLQSGRTQRWPLSLLLFYIILEVLARQRKRSQRHKVRKGRNNTPYLQVVWVYVLTIPREKNNSWILQEHRTHIHILDNKNKLYFYRLATDTWNEIEEITPFTIPSKNIKDKGSHPRRAGVSSCQFMRANWAYLSWFSTAA